MPDSTTSTTTNATANKTAADNAASDSATAVSSALPGWLQPGVSSGVHILVRIVLISLNFFLLVCGVLQVFSPHFEVMFLISLGLTICYFILVAEVGRIHVEASNSKSVKGKSKKSAASVKKDDSSVATDITSKPKESKKDK